MSTFVFLLSPSYAVLTKGSPEVVDRLLRISDPGSGGDTAMNLGMWDGLIHFFDTATSSFPVGLFPRLKMRLEKRGHTVKHEYTYAAPVVPPVHEKYLCGIDMRDYQVEAANEGLSKRCGVLALATGAGKSYILSAIAGAVFRATGKKFIIIVPNQYLLHQTGEDVKKYLGPDVRVGFAGDGIKQLRCDILVGTYQTLGNGIGPNGDQAINQFFKKAVGVLCDEGHHATASSIKGIYKECENAVFRLACTGTADKHDRAIGKKRDDKAKAHRWTLESVTGPVLYVVTNKFLIEHGYNAKPTVYVVNDRSAYGKDVKTPPPNPMIFNGAIKAYKTVFDRAVLQDRTFNRSVCRVAAALLENGKPPFIFSHSVKHLQVLYKVAKAMNLPCELVTSSAKSFKRREVVKRFNEQQDIIVFSSPVFDEGMSISGIRSVIFGSARKSVVEVLQRIGRGLRKKDDDNSLIVVDFSMPHSTLLSKQFRSRKATYLSEGFDYVVISDMSSVQNVLA